MIERENYKEEASFSRELDAVRLVANYLIVLMHAYAAYQYGVQGSIELKIWDFICNAVTSVALPALFFLSGYLMMRNFSPATYGEKLIRRVKRLVVPYLAWNFFFVAFYLLAAKVVPRMAQRVSAFGLETGTGILGKTVSFMSAPIDMPTWFMRTLFLYSILSIVFYWFFERRSTTFVLYGLVGIWIAVSTYWGIGGQLKFSYPGYSLVTFVLGCHLSRRGTSPFKFFQSPVWLLVGGIGVLGVHYYNLVYRWPYSPIRDMSFLLELPLLFCSCPVFIRMIERLPGKEFLRKSSFFLYTGHFLFCSMVLHLVAPRFSWMGVGKVSLLMLIFCTVGVAVNLFVYRIGKRLLGRVFGIWDGTL